MNSRYNVIDMKCFALLDLRFANMPDAILLKSNENVHPML